MFRLIAILLTPLLVSTAVSAAIPLQINHQGVVKVNGTPFGGSGDFRFAIVDPDTGINLWTNDGTNIPGPGSPTAAVNLLVTNGVYDVRLGNALLTNMNVIPTTVFNDDNVVLRIWFDDTQGNGIHQLIPDHVLTSAGYAYHALDAESATFATTAGDADTVDGLQGSAVEESAEIDADIAVHAAIPSAHHARYTDAEAIEAVGSPAGPVGAVVGWLKSFPNTPSLPDGWVECNGQVLVDAGSPYDGQTIPLLNGTTDNDSRFLRGETTSGNVGGTSTHSHGSPGDHEGGDGTPDASDTTRNHIPPYYSVVWIMKVK